MSKKQIAIFGSTGSIGKNTIEVIKNAPEKFEVISLIAKQDFKALAKQALDLKPKYVVIEEEKYFKDLKEILGNLPNCEILAGREAVLQVAKIKYDLAICAIVGFAGMVPTLNAIKAGSNIALANKESLVCGGEFLIEEAKKNKVKILPVDSEHNAIFQIFENDNLANISQIILTASGGPFFNKEINLAKVTPAQALKHPNWDMGAKVSIDSATMMNKGLEVIEAFHLFDISEEQIEILIHPESIIHGLVNYNDGSTLSMLSNPDMKVPISYALSYPNRMKIKHEKLDLANLQKLEFFAVDHAKFPAVNICFNAMKQGGNAPVILNAANEIAVAKFLNEEISFNEITNFISDILNKIPYQKLTSIADIIAVDDEVRKLN